MLSYNDQFISVPLNYKNRAALLLLSGCRPRCGSILPPLMMITRLYNNSNYNRNLNLNFNEAQEEGTEKQQQVHHQNPLFGIYTGSSILASGGCAAIA